MLTKTIKRLKELLDFDSTLSDEVTEEINNAIELLEEYQEYLRYDD